MSMGLSGREGRASETGSHRQDIGVDSHVCLSIQARDCLYNLYYGLLA